MTDVTRRERIRAATELEIRQRARTLLRDQGRDAVTLRAIARELGITAPALYRYCNSREDLLRQLCDDICTDLSSYLGEELSSVDSGEQMVSVFTVCRAFRRWALAHPEEFGLVFATPPREPQISDHDRFAGLFLGLAGRLMSENGIRAGHKKFSPELERELAPNKQALASALAAEGIDLPAEAIGAADAYFLLRWWIRLYGHVALEVFGRFPFDVKHADRLFDSLLTELSEEVGLQQP